MIKTREGIQFFEKQPEVKVSLAKLLFGVVSVTSVSVFVLAGFVSANALVGYIL